MNHCNGSKSRRLALLLAVPLLVSISVSVPSAAQDLKPVTIRIASDHSGPPHPAALAQVFFQERLPKVIPGSQLRPFYAGALYKIPDAVDALREGNLEMVWGQFGKAVQIDPWMSVVVGPMQLTTPGSVEQMDSFETTQMLFDRLEKEHGVKVFGTGHLSFFIGVGSSERLRAPKDFTDKKIRSFGPVENAALAAWGASPVTMAFGDVPPALQTGVIDGLLTSIGGFVSTRDQAPYFSIAGLNAISSDYYWIGASAKWWNTLDGATQEALEKLIVEEVIPMQKKLNWCNDQRVIKKYRTEDPSKPGIYVLTQKEQKVLADKMGDATINWIKSNTPDDANKWVDRFADEARAAVAENPLGSSEIEKTDCSELAHWFTK
jgi:TRAP-type C4-dicarboxylate transport system substrate-binding protein